MIVTGIMASEYNSKEALIKSASKMRTEPTGAI